MRTHSQIRRLEGVSRYGSGKVARHCYLELALDGNKWHVLFGLNLQEGIAGFGDSPTDAVEDFERQFTTRSNHGGWSAWVNGREGWKVGRGATEAEAIRDLLGRVEGIAA